MKKAPLHPQEKERLEALRRLKILDSDPEQEFDDITAIANLICGTPIALISLVDESRQWFKSKQGLAASEIHRDYAFCAHAILGTDLFTVADVRNDERFSDNPLVAGEPHVAFYAGVPISAQEGYPIGTLCVIDHKERTLSDEQNAALRSLANQVNRLFKLRTELLKYKEEGERLEYKRVAIDNLTEGVVLQDHDARIIDYNFAALAVLGLTADQLTGKTSLDPDWRSIHPDGSVFQGHQHPAVVTLKTGLPQRNVIMGVHRPNSELAWLQINSTPLFKHDSTTPFQVITSFTDISLQIQAQSQLTKSKADVVKLLNGLPAMIGHWNKDLINLAANSSYTSYFGKTPDETKGQSLRWLMGDQRFEENYPYVQLVLNGEMQSFERMLEGPDGKNRSVLSNYLPDIKDGAVDGFFVIVTDVTELKRLESDREVLHSKMIESAKFAMLGEMAGGIAHEINTPLAIIHGKTALLLDEALRGGGDPAEAAKQLEKIKVTTERIAKIVKGLRQFSRNAETDDLESVAIAAVVESTMELCKEKIKNEQIDLHFEGIEQLVVSARFSELSQVFMSLIGNAIDAVENLPERWINVHAVQEDCMAKIMVTDSGRGIPKHIQEKIMNPFFTTKPVGKGTGLGLSIATGIIQSHRGRLYVDEKCENTRFVVEIPLRASTADGGAA